MRKVRSADLISSSFILHSSSFINPTFFTLPMADALVSIVLERLTSVVEQQIHEQVSLVQGVKSEIQSLKKTLRSVRDVLEDAERRQVKDKSVQGWLESLKDMAYEMEDVLDEWSIAILQFQMEGVENASTSKKKVNNAMSQCLEGATLPKAGGTAGPRAPEGTIAEIEHQIFSCSGTTLSKGYWRGWAQNISYPRSRIFTGLNGHHASPHVALVTEKQVQIKRRKFPTPMYCEVAYESISNW
ncbi:unnamed protein product, partial [Vitis vinifera]